MYAHLLAEAEVGFEPKPPIYHVNIQTIALSDILGAEGLQFSPIQAVLFCLKYFNIYCKTGWIPGDQFPT